MQLQEKEIQLLEELVCDEAFNISFFCIELPDGQKLEIQK